MKVAIVVADSFGEPFDSIRNELWDKNWAPFKKAGFEVFKYIGSKNSLLNNQVDIVENLRYTKLWPIQYILDKYRISRFNSREIAVLKNNDLLSVDTPEGLRYLGVKTFAVLHYFFKNDYDLIYKTTMSSILSLQLFRDFISKVDLSEKLYGGTIIKRELDFDYISGANLFINKKAFEILSLHRRSWNHAKLEDVAIGKILSTRVKLTPVSSINISNLDILRSISASELSNTLHIRCTARNGKDRDDLDIMKQILLLNR